MRAWDRDYPNASAKMKYAREHIPETKGMTPEQVYQFSKTLHEAANSKAKHGETVDLSKETGHEIKASVRSDEAPNGAHDNGIPKNKPGIITNASIKLARVLHREHGLEEPEISEIPRSALPSVVRGAFNALEKATGKKIVIFRHDNPKETGIGRGYDGVSLKDGTLYINENAAHPVTTVASHEFVHELKSTHPELYKMLEDEVRRQGRLSEHAEASAKLGVKQSEHVEELTADATADALTDKTFLEETAKRNPGAIRTDCAKVHGVFRFAYGQVAWIR